MTERAILIADDDLADVDAVKRVLIKARVINPVHTVPDGAEAISYLTGDGPYADRTTYPHPVLLLLDLAMPRKTGLEVLDWLRGSPVPEHKAMGKIVLAGTELFGKIRPAYLLGAHSFLLKPLRVEDFVSLMNSLKGIRVESDERGRLLDYADRPAQ